MKILVSLNNKNIKDYLNYTNSFIIGLKEYSINYLEFDIDEIKELLKNDIELFVAINRNLFNNDLDDLEKKIIELSKLNIKGIMFYDLAVLEIVKRNNLSIDLVWHQEHMVTNYNTCNYYLDKGVKYAYIASDITTDEIIDIHLNSKIKLITYFFGLPLLSFSKRKLITNYFDYLDKDNNKDLYEISSNDVNLIIKENKYGTAVLYNKILNGIKPLSKLKNVCEYGVLDENLVDHDIFIKVLKIYSDFLNNKIDLDDAFNKVYELTNSDDSMFFDKETIYKVNNHEKN